eukprot:5092004-Pleurochrysis_carterae.AAC.4
MKSVSAAAGQVEVHERSHVQKAKVMPVVLLWNFHSVLHVVLPATLLLGVGQLLEGSNVGSKLLLGGVVAAAPAIHGGKWNTTRQVSRRQVIQSAAEVVRLHLAYRSTGVGLGVAEHCRVCALSVGVGVSRLNFLLVRILVLRAFSALLAAAPDGVRAHVQCESCFHGLEVGSHDRRTGNATAVGEVELLARNELVEPAHSVGGVLAQ